MNPGGKLNQYSPGFKKRGVFMKEYKFDRKIFNVEITLTGVFCIVIILACIAGAIMNKLPGLLIFAAVIAAYTAWNDFVSISNPEKVVISDDFISFYAFGREHKYPLSDISQFRVREFPTSGKIFLRVNNANIFKGRYWLHTKMFSDGKELFTIIRDMEFKIHPDSLKARARIVNTEFAEAERKIKANAKKTNPQ